MEAGQLDDALLITSQTWPTVRLGILWADKTFLKSDLAFIDLKWRNNQAFEAGKNIYFIIF